MEFNELKELIDLFSKSNVDQLNLERKGFNLQLKKRAPKVIAAASALEVPTAIGSPSSEAAPPGLVEDAVNENLAHITSPIVGTFYRASNPNASPFVNEGDRIRKGQTLCIIEAMKLMNEIQADQDGVIEKILVENGQGVEFDQRLFAIKPV